MVKRVFVLISFIVAILVIGGNAFAHIPNPPLGPEWKLVGIGSRGTTHYVNTRSITYLPGGIVEVWSLGVPRGELRRFLVNLLKQILSLQGKDPNNAERLWYIKSLDKINCRTHQYASVKMVEYSFEKTVLHSILLNAKEWENIPPGIAGVEKYVCNEAPASIPAPQTIPEPSLSSEWKLVGRNSDGTTLYVNTRKTTHLPGGIVKVRTLWVPRGEFRRTIVNDIKKQLLSKGEDPSNAKRFWYDIQLGKINCKTNQWAPLEIINYSFEKAVLDYVSSQHEEWYDITPGTAGETIEKYVCNETPLSIPEPSLGPEWKLVFTAYNGSTFYVNTRSITYLPGGIVEVRTLSVPRGELRMGLVDILKDDLLSKGEDPNEAKRLWYETYLDKFNCKTHQSAPLEEIDYSLGKKVLDDYSVQHEEWGDIVPGGIGEKIENYVCKKYRR